MEKLEYYLEHQQIPNLLFHGPLGSGIPRCTSWLMETTLIPNYHYVLLKDDFSDLEEKILLCNKHPKECKQIIRNANEYMKQFSNQEVEQRIENAVIQEYFKRIE